MDTTVDKLEALSKKIELLLQSSDWITKETVHIDNSVAQTGTLINVLAQDIQEGVYSVVHELEQALVEWQTASHLH